MSMNAVPNGPPEPGKQGAPVAGGGVPPDNFELDRRLTVLETRFDTILPTLATKADLAELRLDMHEKVDKLRSELNELRLELNEKIDRLRAEVNAALMSNMRWCVGIAMTVFVAIAGQGVYLGARINSLATRLPPASPVTPLPERPAASLAPPQAPSGQGR
ncbi:hypothetical protein INH39_20250 [Massilia violaceinigra]|uniref:DUF1640 domain-containing protein n=1 Tax=Massilia violaceinigra TaxID=2045208 RepID=A0ABY3ZZB3_9BURK|nr:CCDC90 family protein [Massilia violaceinigra]UOD27814.1 hypothetical protein INH39_20250 [Massilia violaceinigra]